MHGDVVNFPKHVAKPSEFLYLPTHTQSTWTREKVIAVVMWLGVLLGMRWLEFSELW